MNKIHIICFLGCYLLAWAAELFRRWKYSDESEESTSAFRLSGWTLFIVTVGFTLAGLFAQTLYLSIRVNLINGVTPLSNLQGALLCASWMLSVIYLAALKRNNYTIFPLMILTTSLALILAAAFWASEEPFGRQPVMHAWGLIHGISQLTFFVSLTVGVIAGILYLWQDRRLKRKLPRSSWRLPSLERLAGINRASLIWSLVAMAPGIFSGVILLGRRQGGACVSDYLFDPTILGSTIIFFWILWTVIRSASWGGFSEAKATARRTIFLFILLALTLIAAYYSPVGHWRGADTNSAPQPAIQEAVE